MRKRAGATWGGVLVAALVAAGCGPGGTDAETADDPTGPAAAEAAPTFAAAPDPAEWEALEAHLHAAADTADRRLRRVPNLDRREQAALREDVNATQIARARALGVRAGDAYEEAAARGRLVRLADTTRYWIVRELDFSVPYVTPGTEAMLAELGRRFHARLDSLGLPPYRMDVTSVLRTPEKQAALRRTNPNASQGVSAHEFGTTLDVAYRRFHPPAEGAAPDAGPAWAFHATALGDSLLAGVAHQRSAELQAVLGRVLLEMRREGKLMVMMERRQTVYHMTVARRFPDHRPVPPLEGRPAPAPPPAAAPDTRSAER
jgi:hypothetical protein